MLQRTRLIYRLISPPSSARHPRMPPTYGSFASCVFMIRISILSLTWQIQNARYYTINTIRCFKSVYKLVDPSQHSLYPSLYKYTEYSMAHFFFIFISNYQISQSAQHLLFIILVAWPEVCATVDYMCAHTSVCMLYAVCVCVWCMMRAPLWYHLTIAHNPKLNVVKIEIFIEKKKNKKCSNNEKQLMDE